MTGLFRAASGAARWGELKVLQGFLWAAVAEGEIGCSRLCCDIIFMSLTVLSGTARPSQSFCYSCQGKTSLETEASGVGNLKTFAYLKFNLCL